MSDPIEIDPDRAITRLAAALRAFADGDEDTVLMILNAAGPADAVWMAAAAIRLVDHMATTVTPSRDRATALIHNVAQSLISEDAKTSAAENAMRRSNEYKER